MITRRELLQYLPGLPLAGTKLDGNGRSKLIPEHEVPYRDFFKELGLRTFINAAGTYTALTGSLMREETVAAVQYAARQYVDLDALQDVVGKRVASLLHCDAATVTAGAASAMTLGTAGVLAGMDEEKVVQLPDLTGMKSEVIIQRSHDVGYTHAIRNTGVKMVYVDSRQELLEAINEKTAMLLFMNFANNDAEVRDEEFVAIGKEYGIPTFNDCAADVPPVENLWKYTDMGFDLVCFSGGKGLRGPQSTGLLLGRKDLIAAARLHAPPRGNTLGRGMKVNKEEVLGMLVALENYLLRDHEADRRLWEKQVDHIGETASLVSGVSTRVFVPEIANHVPTLSITWDEGKIKISPRDARTALQMGHPSIETKGEDDILITTWMMRPGEERTVAERVYAILSEAAV
jgi:L-seryl-tRNA(Ser) seleniumtransferase